MTRLTIATIALLAAIMSLACAKPAHAQEATPAPSPAPTETAVASPVPSQAPEVSPAATATPGWVVRLTPYLWGTTVNGDFHFLRPDISLPPGAPIETDVSVQAGPNSYLSKLNSAAMLEIEADKSNLVMFGDVIYANLSNVGAHVIDIHGPLGHISFPLNVSTDARITSTIATAGVGGEYMHSVASTADAFVGLRYEDITAHVSWTLSGPIGTFAHTGSASANKSDAMGIIGTRARLGFSHGWFVPLYVDFGGSAELTTYQWVAGVAHGYHSGAQIIAWRQMAFFENPGQNGLLEALHLGGPVIAWSFYL